MFALLNVEHIFFLAFLPVFLVDTESLSDAVPFACAYLEQITVWPADGYNTGLLIRLHLHALLCLACLTISPPLVLPVCS